LHCRRMAVPQRPGSVSFTVEGSTGGGGEAVFRVDASGRITKNGDVFPVRCGSWFGLEGRHEPSNDAVNPSGAPMELYIGNTFYANGGAGTGRTIQQTMTEIVDRGINVIRLPVVPQTLDPNDPQASGAVLKNHPSVQTPNALQALEEFIVLADQNNLEILLDIHACSNYVGWRAGRLDARPPYVDADREDYDFPREDSSCAATNNPGSVARVQAYDEAQWLSNLQTLATMGQRLGVDNIIGIDIYNEPWDYTWSEWKALSEAAYQAIDAVNPNILIFVQGISASAGNQDGSPETFTQTPHGNLDTNPNWGENLFEATSNPLNIPKDRLVFSPHTYGPSVFVQKMFMDPAQPECNGLEGDEAGDLDCNIVIDPPLLREGWDEHFGYLRALGFAVVVGEFGGNLDWPGGQASLRDQARWSHITPGVDGLWQDAFVDYMNENNIEGCYWSINPESGDTAGWYGHTYDPISNAAGWGEWLDFDARKTTLLERLWNFLP
ncbi:MAG: glycoside hydrolase family 5 protein, partial [Myxococcota bacterium]